MSADELRRGDGQWLDLGWLEPNADKWVVIPYSDAPNVEHKYALTLYTDYEHDFVKIDPRLNCDQCGNPSGMFRVLDTLDRIEALSKRVLDKEKRLAIGDDGTNADFFTDAARAATADHSGPKTDYGYGDLMGPPQGPGGAIATGADAVDVSDMVQALKTADADRQRDASSQSQQVSELERQRQQQLDEIERLKGEL